MKQRGETDENGEPLTTELSVYDYFVNVRKISLKYSGDLPCINVGKPKRPTYIPLEVNFFLLHFSLFSGSLYNKNYSLTCGLLFNFLQLCSLVSLQRYTKALTTLQRAQLVEKSRQKPQDRMKTLTNVIKNLLNQTIVVELFYLLISWCLQALRINNYADEPLLRACGVSVSNNFTQVEGRILAAPRVPTFPVLSLYHLLY